MVCLNSCVGTPWCPRPSSPGAGILPAATRFAPTAGSMPVFPTPAAAVAADTVREPMRFSLTRDVLEKIGYSDGCPGCSAAMIGLSRNHTEACRARVEAALHQHPEFAAGKERADTRRVGFDGANVNRDDGDQAHKRLATAAAGFCRILSKQAP